MHVLLIFIWTFMTLEALIIIFSVVEALTEASWRVHAKDVYTPKVIG